MNDEETNSPIDTANDTLEDTEGDGWEHDPNGAPQAAPLVKQDDGNYMGPIGSVMTIEIIIKGGLRAGKAGTAQHFIDSIIERFGDDRPVQIHHVVGDTTVHSKKYNQTITASRAYAPILKVDISEEN